jgi:hypothetical protein
MRNVTTADVITAALSARMAGVHTAIVGRVEVVHATARKVDVRPSMLRVLQTAEGEPVTEQLPVLQQVPIGALRAGAARIDMPISVGCWVCVLFFEDNIGKWLAAGGVDVSPGDVERHGLTGAVALPILYPDPERPAEALDQVNVVIRSGAGSVLLGGTSGHDFVALAAKVDAEITKLKADITTLRTATAAAVASIGAKLVPADPTVIPGAFTTAVAAIPSAAASVTAAKVKAT